MSCCIQCEEDGTLSVVRCDQRSIANRLGGAIGFVGAVAELNIFIVGLTESSQPINKVFESHSCHFHEVARGTLIFIGSDENGEEMDVDVDAFYNFWGYTSKTISKTHG
jgi:hypothetical protein